MITKLRLYLTKYDIVCHHLKGPLDSSIVKLEILIAILFSLRKSWLRKMSNAEEIKHNWILFLFVKLQIFLQTPLKWT